MIAKVRACPAICGAQHTPSASLCVRDKRGGPDVAPRPGTFIVDIGEWSGTRVIEIRNYYLSETNFVKGIFSFRLSSMKFRFEPFTI